MITFKKLSPNLGAEVSGLQTQKILAESDKKVLHNAWYKYGILLFRDNILTEDQQIAFTKNFGKITQYTREKYNDKQNSKILVLSNIIRNEKLIGSPVSGRVWHTDGHYLKEPPAGSLLYSLINPPVGGDTWFASMTSAWKFLPKRMKSRLDSLKVIISRIQSRPYNYPERSPVTEQEKREWQDVTHPVVRTHPKTGDKALYVGGNVPWLIENIPLEESLPLITWLQEFSIMDRFIYKHHWCPGDIILWDNRSVIHKAMWYDNDRYQRLMHRTTIAGDIPF